MAIVLAELPAKLLAGQIPACRDVTDLMARRFKEATRCRWGRIVDFLKLHFALTDRTDTAFWRDNADTAIVAERLKELLNNTNSRARRTGAGPMPTFPTGDLVSQSISPRLTEIAGGDLRDAGQCREILAACAPVILRGHSCTHRADVAGRVG